MLIDAHCHVPHAGYKKDVDSIIEDASSVGVSKLIVIGTSISENEKVIKFVVEPKHANIFCSIGIYPHEDMDKSVEELREALESALALSEKIVAIGECGIDVSNWQGGRSIEDQIKIFEMQIQVALDHDLPIIIHNRNGDAQVMALFNKYHGSKLRGVAHSFSQSWEVAQQYLDLGFYISFSGMITYPARKPLLETVAKVPLDRFLVETDSPYLPPQGHRGEPNYPEYVKIVAEKVAQVKEKPFDEIADWSYKNTCTVFNKLS